MIGDNSNHFRLEIDVEGKAMLDFKHIDRDKFLSESKRIVNDFLDAQIKTRYDQKDAVKNTTIRLYTY
jgi:hypothetical protein